MNGGKWRGRPKPTAGCRAMKEEEYFGELNWALIFRASLISAKKEIAGKFGREVLKFGFNTLKYLQLATLKKVYKTILVESKWMSYKSSL